MIALLPFIIMVLALGCAFIAIRKSRLTQIERFTIALARMEVTIGSALLPAVRNATKSFEDLSRAFANIKP